MRTKFSGILTLLLAFVVQISFAQVKTISGTVTDDTSMPLPGVNILIKGTTTGTQTDFDGNYTINASIGQTLVFSYVGFTAQEVAVTAATSSVSIQLASDNQLGEVVITTRSNLNRTVQTSAAVTISSEDINQLAPTTSIDNMLQGKAAGVSVTAANGKPGQGAFVRIRGMGSLTAGASSPLYIVDGSPIDERDLGSISAEDVENIEILKDAPNTARYGSRGANGVVLITTKSGNRNKEGTIRFSSRYGVTNRVSPNYTLMNAEQKMQYEAEMFALGVSAAGTLPGVTTLPGSSERAFQLRHAEDWEDLILKDGIIQSNTVDFHGGTEVMDYFFSVGHSRNTGIIDQINGYERINSRLNVNFDVNNWLTIGANVGFSRAYSDEPRDRYNSQNPFYAMMTYSPYETEFLLNEDGTPVVDENNNNVYNPTHQGFPIRGALLSEPFFDHDNLTLAKVNAVISFSERWSYEFITAVSHNHIQAESYSKPGGILDNLIGDPNAPGNKYDRSYHRFDMTLSNNVNYNLSTDNHSFNALGLFEYNFNEYNNLFLRKIGFPSASLTTQYNASTLNDGESNRSRLTLLSYGLFTDYDYKKRYFVSASVRADGSSNFGSENRFGIFYSGSVAWDIANESFFNVDAINSLKLRGSYGTVGNRLGIGRYDWIPMVGLESYPANGSVLGSAYVPGSGNPELKWETTEAINVGLEFNLVNNRIRGVVDYFKRNTTDLLFLVPRAHEAGVPGGTVPGNIGEIENKGFEVSLQGDIVRNNNFTWTLGGNVMFLDHRIVELPNDGADIIPLNAFNILWREGEPINQHYFVRFAGVDSDTGRPLFYGGDGNIYFGNELADVEDPNGQDHRVADGRSTIADIEGGFFTNLNYKGWGLRADFVFKAGNYVDNWMKYHRNSNASLVASNQAVTAFNYWKQPGDNSDYISPMHRNEFDAINSDAYLEKGDYIRMRNVTLSYTFPKSKLEKTPFSSLRLYVQGQNLLTLTEFWGDPEVGISSGESIAFADTVAPGEVTLYSYPNLKSYQIGLDVSF